MQVRDGMSEVVLTVGPGHTLREAAKAMAGRRVGAAVVMDPDGPGPGIITERDILRVRRPRTGPRHRARRRPPHLGHRLRGARLVARGGGGGRWCAAASATSSSATGGEVAGVLSVRDIVRCWTADGATSGMAAPCARLGTCAARRGAQAPRGGLGRWCSRGGGAGARRCRDACRAIQRDDRERDDQPRRRPRRASEVVTPSSATVMPMASSSGWMLGPGRWISSPAGPARRADRPRACVALDLMRCR